MNRRHADFQSKSDHFETTVYPQNNVKLTTKNQALSSDLSNLNDGVKTAALWLAVHREECKTAIIPFVRKRFSLTILEAIEALKIGHKMSMGGNR